MLTFLLFVFINIVEFKNNFDVLYIIKYILGKNLWALHISKGRLQKFYCPSNV